MSPLPHLPYMRELLIFLVTAAVLVPLFQRLRISPVLGFLICGVILGPWGLGLFVEHLGWLRYAVIDDIRGVQVLAEFGIVFLLFMIGLELSWERLWSLRRLVFGLGSAQVFLSTLLIGLAVWALGQSMTVALLLGACLALSSTAVVLQCLVEREQLFSYGGQVSFSILLLQDLAVIPLLFLLSVLTELSSGAEGANSLRVLLVAAPTVIGILLAGRLVSRPLLHIAARGSGPEFFTAMALLLILGTALLTAVAGLPMAMGAFLAGLLLSETEFCHQIRAEVAPFKGLLLGLFFMSVGMGIDTRIVFAQAPWLALAAFGLCSVKMTVATVLCLLFGVPRHVALQVGISLAQGGEFAFVVVGLALASGVLPQEVGQFALVLTGLTMMATPGMVSLGTRTAQWLAPHDWRRSLSPEATETSSLEGHVIIAGYGRVGQEVSHLLGLQHLPCVALDNDGALVARHQEQGIPVFYGDAGRRDVLESVSASRATALLLCMNQPDAVQLTIRTAHAAWPQLPIYVRARGSSQVAALRALGATDVIPETSESSLQLAGRLLNKLGMPSDAVNAIIEQIRCSDYADLQR